MKSKNKIYTKSYFKKRLLEAGFTIKDPEINYDLIESRYWSLVVDVGRKNIFVTCYRVSFDNFWFNFSSEKVSNFKIYTKSMEVIEEQLHNLIDSKPLA